MRLRAVAVGLIGLALAISSVPFAAADVVVRSTELGLNAPSLLVQTNGRLVGAGNHLMPGTWGTLPGLAQYETTNMRLRSPVLAQMSVSAMVGSPRRNAVFYVGDDGIGRFDIGSESIGQLVTGSSIASMAIDPNEQFIYAVNRPPTGFHTSFVKYSAADLNSIPAGPLSVILNPDDPTPDGSTSYPDIVIDQQGEFAYVLAEPVGELIDDDSELMQIRLSDLTVTQSIPIGQDVNYLAISNDGSKVYATSSNQLNKIVQPRLYEIAVDATLKVTRVQNAQGSLGQLGLDSFAKYGYVAQRGPDVVLKYDLKTLRVVDTIQLKGAPSEIAISSDGSLVYVATALGMEKVSIKPEILGISPSRGSITGTTPVAVRGRYISPDAEVTVGGEPCVRDSRQPTSAYHCTLRQTDQDVGSVNVRVVNPGDQKDVEKDIFTFTRKQYPVGRDCFNPSHIAIKRGLIPAGCHKTSAGSLVAVKAEMRLPARGDLVGVRLVCRTARGSKAQKIVTSNGYVRCGKRQTLKLAKSVPNRATLTLRYYAPSIKNLKPFRKSTRVVIRQG